MNKYKTLAAATVALLLMAACGTSGNSIGDIFGGGNPNGSNAAYQIRGTVDSVDARSQSIYLTNVSGYNGLNSGSSRSLRVYYDNRTTLNYQGRSYRPDQLERGDEVSINVDQSGNQLIAQSMEVTYNTNGGMASGSNGTYGYPSTTYPSSSSQWSTIRGTVRNVDTRNQTIELENTNWVSGFRTNNSNSNRFVVRYDPNASVDYNGQMYPLTNLERGDVVDVQLQDMGNSSYVAQRLVLVRNVR
ncbi:MAG TPA: hypothetical protein VHY33_11675 [Thermoanaerobaculia bacterium]|jgi:hypothetical protein|nr:hypothetical protein [Thermoanaerobaculia bacterium]